MYFQEGKELEDYGVILRLFDKVDKMYFEKIPMYDWYQYSSSQSKRGFHENKLTCLETIDSMRQYFERNITSDKEIIQALDYFEFLIRYGIINEMWKSESVEVRKRIKEQLKNVKRFIPSVLKNKNRNMTIIKYIVKIYVIQMKMIRYNK